MNPEQVELLVTQKVAALETRLGELAADQRSQCERLGERIAAVSDDVRSLVDSIRGGPAGEGIAEKVLRQAASTERQGEAIGRIEARVGAGLGRLEHAVLGNGSPGIAERLRDHERRWALQTKLIWIVVTALASGVVSVALRVFSSPSN